MNSRQRDLLQVTCMYLTAALLGWFVLQWVAGDLIVRAAAADLVMTVFIFACSLWKKNSSAYDAYWSVVPFLLVIWLAFAAHGSQWHPLQWGIMAVVAAWSWRLTLNWARGWAGWHHEDWRYVNFRNEHGALFQLSNFFGIHLFPTVIVFVACLPLFVVATAPTVDLWTLALAIFIATAGVVLEHVADNQLHRFRRRRGRQSDVVLREGIWGVIRYPNYLGEMLFWWGLAIAGLGAGGAWWVLAGAVAMMLMFLLATIPMKDRHMLARRPQYAQYYREVPALIPGFRR